MEGDKEAYLEEASKALKRQRKNLEELLNEKNDLIRKLRVTRSRQNRNKDAENAAKIARLAEEQDTLAIMIKRETQSLIDLDGEINRQVNFYISNIHMHFPHFGILNYPKHFPLGLTKSVFFSVQ